MNHDVPPPVQLIQFATAHVVSKTVYAAAKLGLADHLAAGPKAAAELAAPLGVHAPSLHRLMRTLAGVGVLTEGADQRFGLTATGELLKSDAPGCFRSMILTLCGPLFSPAFDEIEYSIQTGLPAFDKVHGGSAFEVIARRPEDIQRFSETMVAFHGAEPPAIAAAYDFSAFQTIVDVGGATGNLLGHVLARHTQPRGILFDLPHVVTDAPALLAKHGVTARVAIETGSFFDKVPAAGDAYVLSHIIHDWTEAQCLTILGNVRKAMGPSGKLLVVEMVLPTGDTFHPGKILDMVMLTCPGGTERTEAEYAALFAKAGFRLSRVVPTASPVSVIEAVPA